MVFTRQIPFQTVRFRECFVLNIRSVWRKPQKLDGKFRKKIYDDFVALTNFSRDIQQGLYARKP